MRTLWQAEKNQLAWDWLDIDERQKGKPAWLAETEAMQGGYLPPPPDFSSHSPFGGATWFFPDPAGALNRLDDEQQRR